MTLVKLTKEEMNYAKTEAKLQLKQAMEFGGKTSFGSRGTTRSPKEKLEDAWRGLAFEMAFFKYLGVPYNFEQYQHRTGKPDVMVLCEGKETGAQLKAGGPSVIIRSSDKDTEIAISGIVNLEASEITFFGYRNIGEIRQLARDHFEWMKAPRGGAVAIFMPQDAGHLKPIDTLKPVIINAKTKEEDSEDSSDHERRSVRNSRV